MNDQYKIEGAELQQRGSIISLLQSAKLPTEDLPDSLQNFLVSKDGDRLIGTVGLEQFEDCGLLRSLVVEKAYRNKNIASLMINSLEERASALGISNIYLLTETASDYFEKKGFTRISRDEVPESVRSSSEFSVVCPVSAIVMKKKIQ